MWIESIMKFLDLRKIKSANFFSALLLISCILLFSSCEEACDFITCENGGECVDGECECPFTFSGENCQIKKYYIKTITKNNNEVRTFEYDDAFDFVFKETYTINNVTQRIYNYRFAPDSFLPDTTELIIQNILESTEETHLMIDNSENNNRDFIYYHITQSTIEKKLYKALSGCSYNLVGNFELFYGSFEDFEEPKLISYQQKDSDSGNCNGLFITYDVTNDEPLTSIEIESDGSDPIINRRNFANNLNQIFLINHPNISKKIVRDLNGYIDPTQSYDSVFIINSDDKPTKETRTYRNGIVDVYEFEYY